ncbi:MAG: glycosyltransferase family 4 protein [Thermoplasmata archaeon]
MRFGEVHVASTYIHPEKVAAFRRMGIETRTPSVAAPGILPVPLRLAPYESMVWFGSWINEALLGFNSRATRNAISGDSYDFVINTSSTIPCEADVFWVQGPPLLSTLTAMGKSSRILRSSLRLGGRTIQRLDRKVASRTASLARATIASSEYVRSVWEDFGFSVRGVVATSAALTGFTPTSSDPTRDYVLAYLGKEVEQKTLVDLTDSGVPVVAFGSKMPATPRLERLDHRLFQWLGYVSPSRLAELYSNALFTAFPFTTEGLGMVPLESMACGTPVLTYNREGPSETVVHGRTGWLVENSREFIRMAVQIWDERSTGIASRDCINQARRFSPQRTAEEIVRFSSGR